MPLLSRVYEPGDINVPCTFCGRGPGQRCKKPDGQDSMGPHRARRDAARSATSP